VGKPRFKPSHVFANPRHFGRTLHGQWAKPNPLNPTETAWAIFQHRAAHTALTTLQQNNQTIDTFATTLGQDLAWLKRNLYGQTPADLGDMIAWAFHLGVDVLPVFDNLSELRLHTV
jgi:hypothetical protein